MPTTMQQHCLANDQSLVLDDALGDIVHCVRGSLWLTQYTDTRDIVLKPGDSFRIDRRTAVIITAMAAACLRLERQARQPARRRAWLSLRASALGGWLRRAATRAWPWPQANALR